MPSIALRSSGVILARAAAAARHELGGVVAHAAAIAVKAAVSISCTSACSSASAAIARGCAADPAPRARRAACPLGVGGLRGVVRSPPPRGGAQAQRAVDGALRVGGRLLEPREHARPQRGQTSRMCTSSPGSIARSIGQSHASAMIAIERTADMQ